MFYVILDIKAYKMDEAIFYTAEKAADQLGISVRVLRDKLNSGEIKGYKKMGKWFVFHSDLVKFIKG